MAEDEKIQVKSYQHIASIGGWAGAGRTLWAISTIGAVFGALIGLVAPLFPVLVGASTLAVAAQAIPASIAVFSAMGISMGFGGGLMLGRVSGTAAAIAEESERRSKEWTIRQIKGMNPDAKIIPDAPEETPPQKSREQQIKDTYRTYINPRVGAVMTLIGIAGGLIFGAAFLASGGAAAFAVAPALSAITGVTNIATNTAAILAYSGGIGAAFGALWNFNFPKITNKLTECYGKLISGKPLGREWCPESEQAKSAPECALYSAPEPQARNFANFQELIARQAQNPGSTLAKH